MRTSRVAGAGRVIRPIDRAVPTRAQAHHSDARAPRRSPTPIERFDTGWLFLLAGLAVLAATVLLPARHDLALAQHRRDAAMAEVERREARIARYEAYLAALDRGDPDLIRSLAAVQLNQIPADVELLPGTPAITMLDADPLPALEPVALGTPPAPEPRSRLEGWAVDDRARLWLMLVGGFLMLVGVLPKASLGRQHLARPGTGGRRSHAA